MLLSIYIFFTIYALLLGTIVLIGFFAQNGKERSYETGVLLSQDDIIVLVPFRDERERIIPLLQSINGLNAYPKEIVFIDDHSKDDTANLITKTLNVTNYRILNCPDSYQGKKKALRWGTENSESKYILTLDADVTLNPNYFNNVSKLEVTDMYVLPVRMNAQSIFHQFFIIDHLLVTAANSGLAGLIRPIMASGANLLYNRSAFEVADDLESHAHMASGDDTYLLRDFRRQRLDTRLCMDTRVEVETDAPSNFKEFISQRLRWIGKTQDLKDHLSTILAVFQSVLTMIFLFLLGFYLFSEQYLLAFITLCFKTGIDMLLFLPFFSKRKAMIAWILIPVYEILFPFYTFILLVLLPFFKPTWKGRRIYEQVTDHKS